MLKLANKSFCLTRIRPAWRIALLTAVLAVVPCSRLFGFESGGPAFSDSISHWICETNSPVKPDFDYATEFYRQEPNAAPGTSCFVRRVRNARKLVAARWTVSGLGVFEAYVNGSPVAAGEEDRPRLKPGFTDMRKTRHAYIYDVFGQVNAAAGATNVFAAEVTAGWWRDRIARFYGKRSAFRAELELVYDDATRARIGTDESWLAGIASPVRSAAIFDGEDFDARVSRAWMVTAEEEGFAPASISREYEGTVIYLEGPWVRWREDLVLHPVCISAWHDVVGADETRFGRIANVRDLTGQHPFVLSKGESLVVDFGQNCAAVPRFVFQAKRGTRLKVLPREMLNDRTGEQNRGNDGPGGSVYLSNVRGARAEVNYVFEGLPKERYAPEFSYFGYRYLSIEATDDVMFYGIESVPVTSIAKSSECGLIETGDPAVNRLVENVLWGFRSNYLSVPTDCPQRNERLGWAADTQIFAPTATRLADVCDFLSKWMHDMRDTQMASGSFASIAPFSEYDEDPDRFGWSDAGIIVPYVLWRRYGDLRVVADNWEAMLRQMRRVSETRHELQPGCVQFADWLSYERYQPSEMTGEQWRNPSEDCRRYWNFLGACYWLSDARMMLEMAKALKKGEDAAAFAREAEQALAAIRTRYFDREGNLDPAFADLQGANVFALVHDLFPDESSRSRGLKALLKNIDDHGGCLQTGFLGTSYLMRALSKAGAVNTAYSLLLQHKYPSWLYSVDQGATTVWERWNSYTVKDGFGPVSMNSFNHYAYGAVVEWLFETAAGIQDDPRHPGFRRVVLAPSPDRRLKWLKARQRTRNGEIVSAWSYGGEGVCTWTFTVPEKMSALVRTPDGVEREYSSGTYTVEGRW